MAVPTQPTFPSQSDSPDDFDTNAFAALTWMGEMTEYWVIGSLVLAAAESSSSTTPALIADANGNWTIPVTAGKSYKVHIVGTYSSAAGTTGGRLSVVASSAVGTINGYFRGALTSSAAATALEQSISALPANFVTTDASGSDHIEACFVFVCTTSGNLEIHWGSEVNASAAQLNAGSHLEWRRVA